MYILQNQAVFGHHASCGIITRYSDILFLRTFGSSHDAISAQRHSTADLSLPSSGNRHNKKGRTKPCGFRVTIRPLRRSSHLYRSLMMPNAVIQSFHLSCVPCATSWLSFILGGSLLFFLPCADHLSFLSSSLVFAFRLTC